jgi:2-phosphosulpholactate phosphatase
VVDVLRATATIVEALAVGYPRVIYCSSIAAARDLRAHGRVLAGEEHCFRGSTDRCWRTKAGARRRRPVDHGGAPGGT